MIIDIGFSVAKVYNVDKRIDVVKGEKFKVNVSDVNEEIKWFTDNDDVLSVKSGNNSADMTANEVGSSTILITNTKFGVLKELDVNVVETVDMASNLNASSGQPEVKNP